MNFTFQCLAFVMLFQPVLSRTMLAPSRDTTLRRDKRETNFGSTHHITATGLHSNARKTRVGLMKFDTSGIEETEDVLATLELYISEMDEEQEVREVIVRRVSDDFEEHTVTWSTYEGLTEDGQARLPIHRDHIGQRIKVDVSELIVPGEDLKLTLHVDGVGHVKFGSKDHPLADTLSPKLSISSKEEL